MLNFMPIVYIDYGWRITVRKTSTCPLVYIFYMTSVNYILSANNSRVFRHTSLKLLEIVRKLL